MKCTKFVFFALIVFTLTVGPAFSQNAQIERQSSPAGQMLHKLGRGVVNVLTCWVEVPRNVAIEWERTDPATGLVLGTVKGFGWGFTRLATGVFETFTFPFPVPSGYVPMIEPEFVVTDIWGDHVPYVTDFRSNDPEYPSVAPVYPQRFNY